MDWSNHQDILKALIALYYQQTQDERLTLSTKHDNGAGFNAVDAPFLTSISRQILEEKKGVSYRQLTVVVKCLRKYEVQINSLGIERIDLPLTAVIYNKPVTKKLDGILTIDKRMLIFIPKIYPSTAMNELRFRWNGGSKWWEGPLNPKAVREVMELFDNVEKSEILLDWEDSLTDYPTTDIIDNSPMMGFQKEAARFTFSRPKAMLTLSPGLGKTIVSIFAAKSVGGKTLIVAPLSLVRNWQNEIKKWTGEDAQIWHQRLGYSSDWVITNYESFFSQWIDFDETVIRDKNNRKIRKRTNWRCIIDHDFDNLIIDESILIKNRKAQRTLSVKAVRQSFKNVWELSGAPTSRFFDDLWSQLNVLDSSRFSSYWDFASEYCVVEVTRWGWQIKGNKPKSSDTLKKDLIDLYFARTQDQVLDLPDWIIDDFEVDMLPDQQKLYQEMEDEFIAHLPEDTIIAPNVLSQLTRLIQFASNPLLVEGPDLGAKWLACEELLEFEELPAIIWTNFIKTAVEMEKKLSKNLRVASLTGEIAPEQRQTIVDKFQAGDIDVLLAHPAVGKFGYTLTKARTAIYLERSYNGDHYYQSLHRVRRIGTTHSPHVIHLMSSKANSGSPTVDHVIAKILQYRKEGNMSLTTGFLKEAFNSKEAE